MNQTTFEKLQFIELKELVKAHCVSSLGKQLIDQLEPSSNLNIVKLRLNETTEARSILDVEKHIPLYGISNIEHLIQKLAKGIILDPSELVSISDFLRGCRKIKCFMQENEFFAPTLASYANSMMEFHSIEEEINFSIKNNRVDSAASRELRKIRQHIENTEEKIKERLEKFLNNKANKEYIQEFFITKKDARYTIPIKASYKNQVPGTIIELSSKGSTAFIEPNTVTKLSVELAMLQSEEATEEYQILATLSGMLSEKIHEISINIELISQYDMVFAKGKFSKVIDGIEPKLNDYGYIKLVNAKHPLLSKNAVPLHFEIGQDYRGLIITGPNAGGKTIVLKTIGLLSLATMAGLHITAEEGTEISLFQHLFVDIGDNQSIENALSTFSSHVKNLSDILQLANNHTLLLFDEIGSGTEPNEGAALAISILEEFYKLGCITIATTHYGEIKNFSELHPDFMNAAMKFNQESLEPLYQLIIGASGNSNALWISKRMGIQDRILQRAKSYMKDKNYSLDRVDQRKIRKMKQLTPKKEALFDFRKGDRVKFLEQDNVAIVYKEQDKYHNVTVFYQNELIEVHAKRLVLDIPATELYPEGYDLETLFVDFKTRKLEHDIDRGSKKALRKIYKEMKKKEK